MSKEYSFELDCLDVETLDIRPDNEMQRVMQYINDVARHMGMDAYDLHRQILKDWAYNRKFGGE